MSVSNRIRATLALAAMAVSLSFVGSVSKAQAVSQDDVMANIYSSDQTLDDVLSPDELAAEMSQDQNSVEVHASHFAAARPTDRLYILVDKSQAGTSPNAQTARIYLDGQMIYDWKVSTGRERLETKTKSGRVYFSATPVGTFRIQRRTLDYWSETWKAHMPYAQFFNGSVALHATVPMHFAALGTRDSGGCVRLYPTNAKILWDLVDQVGAANVRIEVIDPGN